MNQKRFFILALVLCLFSWGSVPSAQADNCPPVQYKMQRLSEGITYPVIQSGIEDQQIADQINRVFRKHAEKVKKTDEEYKKQYEHDQLISAAGPYYAHTLPSVLFNKECLLSVSFVDESYTGGAHGMHHETVYNFDTRSGRRFLLKDVIRSTHEEKLVNRYLKQQMEKLKKEGRYDFFLDAFKGVDLKKSQFAFNDHGIEIIFQEYEVAPYSNGIIHLKVPYHVFVDHQQ
ncbi:DUF3298 and DUF4163 domain-containing protein [Sporolactobacillus inulinus]|nr:DUF3298 and DUF4163 domain-containing protein [Sporolactobacillus inulinus]GEB77474.1 ferritin [Sporolactobacillus inulinus]